MKTIKDIYDSKKNFFTILEIMLSILIIYYHTYPIFYGDNRFSDIFTRFLKVNLGGVIVAMFFTISGFFIIDSLKKSKNIGEYLKKRIKKIYPPLILFLLAFSLLIAPVVSEIDKFVFIVHSEYYMNYITSNLLFFQNNSYAIYSVFENLPYKSAISGSLWSIKHTIYTYLCAIPINKYLLSDKKNKKINKFNIFMALLFIVALLGETTILNGAYEKIATWNPNFSLFVEFKMFIKLLFFFCAGIFININKDKIKVNKYIVFALLALVVCGAIISKNHYLMYLVLPYLTIVVGCIKCPIRINPYSYHIYIGGFAVQQLLMYYTYPNISFAIFVILSIILSVVYGVISYYLTENIIRKKKVS